MIASRPVLTETHRKRGFREEDKQTVDGRNLCLHDQTRGTQISASHKINVYYLLTLVCSGASNKIASGVICNTVVVEVV